MSENLEFDFDDLVRRMDLCVKVFVEELAGIRAGRASSSMLESLEVDVYGAHSPLSHVATISVADSRMLIVSVWDRNLVSFVDKAIRSSPLGLNPIVEGGTLRIPIPELNADRRKDLQKAAQQLAEKTRVAVRNVRRSGMDALKKMLKEGLSEDNEKAEVERVNKATEEHIGKIDKLLAAKEKDITTV